MRATVLAISIVVVALAAGGAEARKRSGFLSFHAARSHRVGFAKRTHGTTTRFTRGNHTTVYRPDGSTSLCHKVGDIETCS